MIEKMTKYSFILLSSQKDEFLEKIQELGVVDIKRSAKPFDPTSEALFSRIEAVKSEIRDIEKGYDRHLDSLMEERKLLETKLVQVAPWGEFDRDKLSKLGVKVNFYCIPEKQFKESWAEDYALQIISIDNKLVRFVVLDGEDFPIKPIEAPDTTAAELQASIDAKIREMEAYRTQLQERKSEIPELEKKAAEIKAELSRYFADVQGETAAESTLVVYEGFAPTLEDSRLEKAFDEAGIFYLGEQAKAEDNPPIKLRNNRFSKLFECLTGMYGMPVYGEWDPTPILSIFFLLFFAICMGDAGYGLVLIAYGILQDKKIVNIGMFDGLGKLIAVLGVATAIVGFFLGTFFGISLSEASWVPDALKSVMLTGDISVGGSSYALQMVLALCIGVFHICLAMTIKAVLYTKRFGFKANISTWGWLILILGGITTGILAMVGFLPQNLTKVLIIAIGAVSALAIFIFNKPGRNPLLNIGAGLWDTYNMATGILGDVLSYIRLYALGLAGGMLGGAFNNLGGMVLGDSPTWQWLPFVLILLFGHILNLLMSCLGAFVHPLRLTFVEYFKNSGYEGKGDKYNPLKK